MKGILKFGLGLSLALGAAGFSSLMAGTPVEMLAFSMPDGNGGLKLATRSDSGKEWRPIGNFHSFLGSDFGAWGSGKKMHNVRLAQDDKGTFWVVFNPDKDGEVAAYTFSDNFESWKPQEYRRADSDYMSALPSSVKFTELTEETVQGQKVKGTVITVDSDFVDRLNGYIHYRSSLDAKNDQRADQDPWRFKDLKPLKATITLDKENAKPISDNFIGIFFEDINYGADGGLYAELIQNRDFEYSEKDRKEWTPTSYWDIQDMDLSIETTDPIHANNSHYAVCRTTNKSGVLTNKGFDGIVLKKGDKYLFNLFARSASKTSLKVTLTDKDGKVLAQGKVMVPAGKEWNKIETTLTAKSDCADAMLKVEFPAKSEVNLDMISLFPEKTFKGRRNGLREDLAQTLADLQPKFMRFPGGCVSHGNGIDNIYDWKGSVGPLEARKPLPNLWGYHQTRGLGFYEYFQFCEDLGMQPLPVLAAGVPCQNSSRHSHYSHDVLTSNGQQCGIPMEDMPAYIQDILDLVEYANGPADSEWGKLRAEAGHPEPFNMKYLGIGNEDLISEAFKERFKMIRDAVNAKYPDITVVGTVGPFFEGSDYEEGWDFARKENVGIVDEHYYVAPGWYVNNRDYYDGYDRKGPKVYLGEYASHYPGRESNLECALSIGLYLTDVERNADVVTMTSYAPLLSKKGRTQWRPDLIYFDNESISLSPDYYVQQMYGANSGTTYVPSSIELTEKCCGKCGKTPKAVTDDDVSNRFGVSTVIDEKTGDTIVRIANMLPVSVEVDLEGYPTGKAEITSLSGNPRDTKVAPTTTTIDLTGAVEVAPYSFTNLRIKK
ncbi:MAG: carbohydrate binding domain-containing protein [Muribaculaceae bacterium]|nr:carbohydrate binding domain-containing protein [Muribaculaceae bacterium]MDE6554232.1 carbohydrate binding domain-containing protein [Muribaculaceae bacterium]